LARAEAARQGELILAAIPVETGRLRTARVEAILEGIHAAARRQLLALQFDGHGTVVALAAEAIRQMPGTDFILKVAPADQTAFGGQLAGEIRQRTGRSPLNLTVATDPAMTNGGVIVQDAGNFRIWDNQLLPRLERLWPELRRQIAARTSLVENNQPAGGAA
jgi:vacuolar-type H+-ATPase subunit E/Vma4